MKKFIIIALIIIAAGVIFVSCKKQVSEKQNSILVATSSNPYLSGYTTGSAVYFLIQTKVPENNTVKMNLVWVNPKNASPYSDEGKVYYNPTNMNETIQFGQEVPSNIIEFRNSVNEKIDQEGFAIVSDFEDGGPYYSKWTLIN